MRSDWRYGFRWPLALMLAAAVLTPWFGPDIVSPASLADPTEYGIFLRFRLTRTALGLLAGASFALTGCLFQAILRNPLAEPYTLGVSSGAALGAVTAIVFDIAWVWTGSIAGALASLALIGFVFLRQRGITATGLVLAGVAVNSVSSALIMLLHSTAGIAKSLAITTWLIGALDSPPPAQLAFYAAVCLPLSLWVILKAADWDVLTLGEAWAAGRGIPVRSLLWQAALAGSILTAATVSLTGPIAFIGLMVPHIVRRVSGASHRRLMPAAFFAGAAFLVICDAFARTVLRPAEIPAGVITAMAGGPGLIWILRSSRSRI